jgi:hypothetical protein
LLLYDGRLCPKFSLALFVCMQLLPESVSHIGDRDDEGGGDDDSDADEGGGDSVHASAAARKRAHESVSTDDKKAKHARHPSEIVSDPDVNHLDVVHYIDALNTVLRQLMPDDEPARQELAAYAREAREYNRSKVNMHGASPFAKFGVTAVPRPRQLSHRAPATTSRATISTLSAFMSRQSAAAAGNSGVVLLPGPTGATGSARGGTCSISTAPKEKTTAARKLPPKEKGPTTVQSTLTLAMRK